MEKSYLHDGHEDKNEYNNMRDTAAWGSIILCPKGEKYLEFIFLSEPKEGYN